MTKRAAHEPSHIMELPRKIVIGKNTLKNLGAFVKSLEAAKRVSLVSGPHVETALRAVVDSSLDSSGIKTFWHIAPTNDEQNFRRLAHTIKRDSSSLIIGIGGGRAVDAAKSVAHNNKIPFVSVPTAASHDGIASPFVSVIGKQPNSLVANTPLGVFVDTAIISKAPPRLVASGCGDLIANIVAVQDWKLGRDKVGEYYGTYAANLAYMSAQTIIKNATKFSEHGAEVRTVVEALISAGVAACIAGSSRPCSGSEHLFSHALDKIAPGIGLHGEKCGIGAIMMAKLQRGDWQTIRKTLAKVGAPTRAKQIGLAEKDIVSALVMAQSLRPGRYTILKRTIMTQRKALTLARFTGVI